MYNFLMIISLRSLLWCYLSIEVFLLVDSIVRLLFRTLHIVELIYTFVKSLTKTMGDQIINQHE